MEIFRSLIGARIDPLFESELGYNPLHVLLSLNIEFDSLDQQELWTRTIDGATKLLVQAGIDAHTPDMWGRYPIEVAIARTWPHGVTFDQARARVLSGETKESQILSALVASGVGCKPLVLFIEGADFFKQNPLKKIADSLHWGLYRKVTLTHSHTGGYHRRHAQPDVTTFARLR